MRTRSASLSPLAAGVVAITICSAALGQAPDPRPGASTPVQVMNTTANPVPVSVQGSLSVSGNVSVTNSVLHVDALNDILNEPYFVSRSGAFGASETFVEKVFDIPDGKRLIIETITVRAALDAPGVAFVQFGYVNAQSVQESGELSMQAQGTIPGTFVSSFWLAGTHPVKFRVDAVVGKTDELHFFLRRSAVGGTWNVLVAGYLVPLP